MRARGKGLCWQPGHYLERKNQINAMAAFC